MTPEHKKFIYFGYDSYYPSGGLGDIRGSFDTLEEAKATAGSEYYDYRYIINRDTWVTVWDADGPQG